MPAAMLAPRPRASKHARGEGRPQQEGRPGWRWSGKRVDMAAPFHGLTNAGDPLRNPPRPVPPPRRPANCDAHRRARAAVHGSGERQARAGASRCPYQEPLPQGRGRGAVPCRRREHHAGRPQGAGADAARGPFQLRQAGASDAGAGRAAGLGHCLRPHQRPGAARAPHHRRRAHAPRQHQLPSAGEHGDDQHCPRRPPAVRSRLRA